MIVFLLVLASMTCITLIVGKIFYQNISPSAPPGLYMISPNQKLSYGDFVIVSLPINVPSLNVKKGFPLLKKVQGFPGDSYFVDSHGLYIHERMYKTFQRDDLPQIQPGNYTVPENTILFLNDPDISFDSRYLGPIDNKQIIKKVILLIPYSLFS